MRREYSLLVLLFCIISIFWPKQSLLAQSQGFILIKGTPSGAEVFINGKDTGKKTPFQMRLEAGDYEFMLQYGKYHLCEGKFTIQKGQTVTRDPVLKRAYGSIIITSEPSGASICLDGVVLNRKTPDTIKEVSSGQHNLVLSKDMYSDKIDSVTVKDELTLEVFHDLEADYGPVGIVTKPDAAIFIDGENKGSGSCYAKLKPGKHKVEVTCEKYYPVLKEIIVSKGKEEKLNILLKPIVGSLSIMVDPPEASIYLNSKYYGISPKIIDSLAIGEYNLELKKEGFGIFGKHFRIEENKTTEIDTTLYQSKQIIVKSTPDSAEVYYNGSIVGTTPAEIVVNEGSNKLILKKKYYSDKEVSITAEKDNQDFVFNLEIDRPFFNVGFKTIPNNAKIYLYEMASLPGFPSNSTSSLQIYFGVSPYHIKIPVGKYLLKIKKAGYKSFKTEILIKKDNDYTFYLVEQ